MSLADLVQQSSSGNIASEILNGQCFKIIDSKLILRESHVYYYQAQLLLLGTDLDFCDCLHLKARHLCKESQEMKT